MARGWYVHVMLAESIGANSKFLTPTFGSSLLFCCIVQGCYRFEHEGWKSAGNVDVQRSPEVATGQSFTIVAGALSRIVVAGFALRNTDSIQVGGL